MLKNNTLKNALLVSCYSAASLLSFSAYSADEFALPASPEQPLVEGSYVVTFNDPVRGERPVIDPPSKIPHDPVPFGEHSTGQSKEALEMALGGLKAMAKSGVFLKPSMPRIFSWMPKKRNA